MMSDELEQKPKSRKRMGNGDGGVVQGRPKGRSPKLLDQSSDSKLLLDGRRLPPGYQIPDFLNRLIAVINKLSSRSEKASSFSRKINFR